LLSDGKENQPADPNAPKGAFTAARSAKDQGVPIFTISFGTPNGHVELDGADLAVPVEDETLKKVAALSGGTLYSASDADQLKNVYATLQAQFGFEVVRGDASTGWFRLAAMVLVASALAALLINRRLPT
jgi:Ca-activated chloride channel family protein